jgi:hypothetical protein
VQAAAAPPVPAPTAAPTPAAAPTPGGAVSVNTVSVETSPSQVTITIGTNGPPSYKTMTLSGPDRLVIDITGGTMSVPRAQQRIDVAALGVSRVRSAQFKNDPAVARIVVDMETKLDSDIAVKDNSLVVRLKPRQ